MTLLFFLLLSATASAFYARNLAKRRFAPGAASRSAGPGIAKTASTNPDKPRAQAKYSAYLIAWHITVPGALLILAHALRPDFLSMLLTLFGLILISLAALWQTHLTTSPHLAARERIETYVRAALFVCSGLAVLTTFGIIFSLIFESLRFFETVPIIEFLTGLHWSPQTAIHDGQAGQSGAFGIVPIFTGTLLIMAVALVIAAPIGLLIATYLSEYASPRMRTLIKPVIEILAGIPTIVYGFFALLTVGPFIRAIAASAGFAVPAQSAIAAGSVMGLMILPLISSLSDDVINAVPQSLRDGAYALGATKSETMLGIIFPAALPGIVGSLLLAISRAIGETMIVVMAAGRAANLTGNPFDSVTTVTVQVVALLTGDQEFDSTKTLAAFALGLVLFIITLTLNIIALQVVRRYRERFE